MGATCYLGKWRGSDVVCDKIGFGKICLVWFQGYLAGGKEVTSSG